MTSKQKSFLWAVFAAALVAGVEALIPALGMGDFPDTREEFGRLMGTMVAAGLSAYKLHRMAPDGPSAPPLPPADEDETE